MKRERVDKLMLEQGLVDSRTKAQALIMAGAVLVNEQRAQKPSDLVAPDADIRIKGADDPAQRYVGRGGVKLEAALREFAIEVRDQICLDVGASTGGSVTINSTGVCATIRGSKSEKASTLGICNLKISARALISR